MAENHKFYKGQYPHLYDRLFDDLVPATGYAETDCGEMLRVVSRVYRDADTGNVAALREGQGLADLRKLHSFITMNQSFFLDTALREFEQGITPEEGWSIETVMAHIADYLIKKICERNKPDGRQ